MLEALNSKVRVAEQDATQQHGRGGYRALQNWQTFPYFLFQRHWDMILDTDVPRRVRYEKTVFSAPPQRNQKNMYLFSYMHMQAWQVALHQGIVPALVRNGSYQPVRKDVGVGVCCAGIQEIPEHGARNDAGMA